MVGRQLGVEGLSGEEGGNWGGISNTPPQVHPFIWGEENRCLLTAGM